MRLSAITLGLAAVLTAAESAPAAALTISHGDRVSLDDYLVDGKYVLFDFYATWCGPCRQLAPVVRKLDEEHSAQLAVRKINIKSWGSDVARQYGVRSIPYLKLYGPDGRELAQGSAGAVLAVLETELASPPANGGAERQRPNSPSQGPSKLAVVLTLGLAAGTIAVLRKNRRTGPAGPSRSSRPESGSVNQDAWFALVQGSIDGPYSRAEVDRLRRTAHLPPDALVRRRGDEHWIPLSDLLPAVQVMPPARRL